MVNRDLPMEGSLQLSHLLPLPLLRLSLPLTQPLFARLPRHARGTSTRPNSEPFVRQPRFQYAPDKIESPSLDSVASDILAPAEADVDDALEGEAEAVGGVFVEGMRVECWGLAFGGGRWESRGRRGLRGSLEVGTGVGREARGRRPWSLSRGYAGK